MKHYELYTVEDFIRDADFRDWVRDQSDQKSFWQSFLQVYPQKKEVFRQAEQFIRAATIAPERISEVEIRRETEFFVGKVDSYTAHRYPFSANPDVKKGLSRFRLTTRRGMAIAVFLTAVVSVGWYVSVDTDGSDSLLSPPSDVPATQLVETTNPTKQPLRVVLNDGSEITLSTKSRLRYPAHFTGNARIVYLTGEAKFSVTRRNQPFMVYTGAMVVKVLGARFVVRAFDTDQKITVQVLSGNVSVYKPKPEQTPGSKEVDGLILNANQAAVFEKSDGTLTKTLVASPALIGNRSGERRFVYDEVPLATILRDLERGYAISIQFDGQSFEGCKITADLSNESLYQKLDILCKAAPATYEITDGQIVISRHEYK